MTLRTQFELPAKLLPGQHLSLWHARRYRYSPGLIHQCELATPHRFLWGNPALGKTGHPGLNQTGVQNSYGNAFWFQVMGKDLPAIDKATFDIR